MNRAERRKQRNHEHDATLLAKRRHKLREELGPDFGKEIEVAWEDLPKEERLLEVEVCKILVTHSHKVLRSKWRNGVLPSDQRRLIAR